MRLNRLVRAGTDSPIGAVDARLADGSFPVLDLSQAAPRYPPAPAVVERIVAVGRSPGGASYTEVAGLPRLRSAFAEELSTAYAGAVGPEQVHITAGCNQAFCLAMAAIAEPGDEVVVLVPYYFNHDMWLRMSGLVPRYVESGGDDDTVCADLERALTSRTRAVVVVSPGNPTGRTTSPLTLSRYAALARARGAALVLDETYRSFRDDPGPAHDLFADAEWDRTLVSLHSFSKELALPGYRVGAVVASPDVLRQVNKLLDCVAVCAPTIGQEAVIEGLGCTEWRRQRSGEIAGLRAGVATVMADRPGGFELLDLGGFFGWVRHPFGSRAPAEVAGLLAAAGGLLVVPGSAFHPGECDAFRISVGNLSTATVPDLAVRLRAVARAAAA